jgi:choline-sulfatase
LPTTPDQHDLDPHSQRLLKVYDLWDKPLPVDKIRDARRAYFGACSYIDSNVGKLLQTLEDTGLIDDTIIVFSGDHGDMLGERGLWYKMHWFEMAARVPLLISAPGNSRRPGQRLVSTADLLPTFVELAGGAGTESAAGRPLAGSAPARAGRARRSVRRIHGRRHRQPADDDPPRRLQIHLQRRRPCLLFDVHNDPHELEELSQSPQHRQLFDDFLAEARARWDIPAIHQQVLASQRRRRLVADALTIGKLKSWDHQPLVDASQQYMRNHIDLDDLERKARYPQPCQNQ